MANRVSMRHFSTDASISDKPLRFSSKNTWKSLVCLRIPWHRPSSNYLWSVVIITLVDNVCNFPQQILRNCYCYHRQRIFVWRTLEYQSYHLDIHFLPGYRSNREGHGPYSNRTCPPDHGKSSVNRSYHMSRDFDCFWNAMEEARLDPSSIRNAYAADRSSVAFYLQSPWSFGEIERRYLEKRTRSKHSFVVHSKENEREQTNFKRRLRVSRDVVERQWESWHDLDWSPSDPHQRSTADFEICRTVWSSVFIEFRRLFLAKRFFSSSTPSCAVFHLY